jgi:hypothetical protein
MEVEMRNVYIVTSFVVVAGIVYLYMEFLNWIHCTFGGLC